MGSKYYKIKNKYWTAINIFLTIIKLRSHKYEFENIIISSNFIVSLIPRQAFFSENLLENLASLQIFCKEGRILINSSSLELKRLFYENIHKQMQFYLLKMGLKLERRKFWSSNSQHSQHIWYVFFFPLCVFILCTK